MAFQTKIQWADSTLNPWIGCSKVNEGCQSCYAETLMADRYHRVIWGPEGTRRRTKTWGEPLKWNREAERAGERRKVFCASLADVFEDFYGGFSCTDASLAVAHRTGAADARLCDYSDALKPWRNDLFSLIDQTSNLDWLLLTKRPQNVRSMWVVPNRSNVWIGTSIANQRNADEYVPRLLACRGLGPILFLSVEPQIGRVDLSRFLFPVPTVDWVIIGGESRQGKEPRRFQVEWARLLIRQCREANVPCFVKQLGSSVWEGSRPVGKLVDSHGGNWDEWPEDLRVRQFPENFYPQLKVEEVRT